MPERRKSRKPGGDLQARPVSARGGRVTPKGTTSTSGRYTPAIPREFKVSPRWVPVTMGVALVAGMLTIILNYLNVLPGEDPSNLYLLLGLGLITAGFIVATRWR